MTNTRLMDRLFSATEENDAELTAQVAADIEAAHEAPVETEELVFEDAGDGKVAITDKENGEVTIAEKAGDGNYDLSPWMEPTPQPEKFIHPEGDGVTPGQQRGEDDEHEEDHLAGAGMSSIEDHEIAEELAHGGEVCPECGKEECECEDEEAREFSIATDNYVVQRIFSDQEFLERVFSEVIESEECAKVGDIKVEKIEGEDAVIVTSESTGDQARVELSEDEMEVTELDEKKFSELYEYIPDDVYYERYFSEEGEEEIDGEEQFEPLHVVGVDSFNHVLVDAPEYDEESAQDLAARLEEDGVDAVQIFENESEARDYALNLLENLGAEEAEEPEAREFSEHVVYVTRYYSNNTLVMDKMFSEACNDIEVSQAKIEDAIENGDEIETDDEIVTPIDAKSAVIEDKETGEFTKVTLDDDTMDCSSISESEASKLMENLAVSEGEDEDERWDNDYRERTRTDFDEKGEEKDEEREFAAPQWYSNQWWEEHDEENKPWSYNDNRDNDFYGEDDDDESNDDRENDDDNEGCNDGEDRDFSNVYTNEEETKFFSENEYMTEYMVRLFSEEADSKEIEDAIESGEQIENDSEVITPVDARTAIIEDKENGEFTKAVMDDEKLDINPISEAEADELTEGLAVEDDEKPEEKKEDKPEEKKYSTLDKFFAQAGIAPAPAPVAAPVAPAPAPVPVDPNAVPVDPNAVAVDENGNPIDPNAVVAAPAPTVEMIEDKALAAVQSIQAAAAEAESQILNAKAAPVEQAEADLQEAQFSQETEDAETRTFSAADDTLVSWLNNTKLGK